MLLVKPHCLLLWSVCSVDEVGAGGKSILIQLPAWPPMVSVYSDWVGEQPGEWQIGWIAGLQKEWSAAVAWILVILCVLAEAAVMCIVFVSGWWDRANFYRLTNDTQLGSRARKLSDCGGAQNLSGQGSKQPDQILEVALGSRGWTRWFTEDPLLSHFSL